MKTTVEIREARQSDFEFIASLMEVALKPYYGGDHRAHARRIFDAHIAGGLDRVGHFSVEQKMFIAEVDGTLAGVIHVVGKKQNTYKISPLVVDPNFRGGYGVGKALLEHAENYARAHGAKQMYCTVAKQNKSAVSFFVKHGYTICGNSQDHYKVGITELMLYKLFVKNSDLVELDNLNISVVPFDEEKHSEEVKNLILSILPKYFNGVDNLWVEALFAGWRRKDAKDINLKYKLIYVAIEGGRVVGVAGATPKKGEAIKIMPLVAEYPAAFSALLSDLPQLLKSYGHKLYVHIIPTVQETEALQRFGWTIDCMLPGAYNDLYTTQQWGLNLRRNYMRNMRIKTKYFDLIKSGVKTLEVRVGYDNIKQIKVGEEISMLTQSESMVIRVKAIRKYSTFAEMLEHEDPERIAPGMNKNEVRNLFQNLYPPFKEKLGVFVFEISPAK